jgi:hypothetical protein
MKINIRFPNLKGKTSQSAAKASEEKLIKTLDNLIIEEKANQSFNPVPVTLIKR